MENTPVSTTPVTNNPENVNRQEMRTLAVEALELCRLSRKDLAIKMNVTVSTVGNWVNGKSAGSKAQREALRQLAATPVSLEG